MRGAIDSWFTTRLAGLDQALVSGGCRELCIAPAVVGLAGDTPAVLTVFGTLLGVALTCGALASIRLQGRSGRMVTL
ncbi:hypothetical protein ACIQ6K_38485 [Streptomyces sp. NPDC096354]|uniref:hypothetical protein n=1 Tax=Streptomyces sp. NPDC096354 TaxID=3366088 RepID=UPI00380B99F2